MSRPVHPIRSPLALLRTVAFTSALGLGCTDQQEPTAPAADPTAPSFSVDRSVQHFGLGFDTEQYTVITGATDENWASFCSTGVENWDAFTILTVTRPDGSQKVVWGGDPVHVLVWNLPADVCAESPDYTGTARTIITDSDVDLSGRGADATGFTTTGTVTDGTGQQYHLLMVARGTVPPVYSSVDNFVFVQHVVKVQLTPSGR
jgi:hypothetical protein